MKRLVSLSLFATIATMPVIAQTPAPAQIFGTNGCADIIFPGQPWAVFKTHALQPDGKLLLAGWKGNGFPNEVCMVRIDTACGGLDPTFGQNGVLEHFFEERTNCNSIVLQPDGKIVGGGVIAASNGASAQFPAVFRYNTDGSVDHTFNGTGYNNTGFSTDQFAGTVQDVFIKDDGRILAVVAGYSKLGVFRYLPDGTLDNSYSSDGRAEMAFGYNPAPDIIAGVMDPDGSVTVAVLLDVAPSFTYHMALARFTPNGEPDLSFGTDGFVAHPSAQTSYGQADGFEDWSIVRRPGGGYLVGYGVQLSVTSPSVAAFTATGALDPSYGTDGMYHFTNENAAGSGLWMDPDGSAMLFIKHNSNSGPGAIVKLTPSGQQDASFGTNGVLLAPFGQPLDNRGFVDGFRLAGGDIIAYGGNTNGHGTVVRFTLDADANALPVISFDHPDLVVSGGGAIQWFIDGTPINGAIGSTHTPTQNGTYTVEMNSFGCVHTSPPFQFLSTGIADATSPGLVIQQDLAAGVLNIRNDGAPMPWSLVDSSGRELRTGLFATGSSEINLAHLRSGLHLLRSRDSVHRLVIP